MGWSSGRHVGAKFRDGLLEKSLKHLLRQRPLLGNLGKLGGPSLGVQCETLFDK